MKIKYDFRETNVYINLNVSKDYAMKRLKANVDLLNGSTIFSGYIFEGRGRLFDAIIDQDDIILKLKERRPHGLISLNIKNTDFFNGTIEDISLPGYESSCRFAGRIKYSLFLKLFFLIVSILLGFSLMAAIFISKRISLVFNNILVWSFIYIGCIFYVNYKCRVIVSNLKTIYEKYLISEEYS